MGFRESRLVTLSNSVFVPGSHDHLPAVRSGMRNVLCWVASSLGRGEKR